MCFLLLQKIKDNYASISNNNIFFCWAGMGGHTDVQTCLIQYTGQLTFGRASLAYGTWRSLVSDRSGSGKPRSRAFLSDRASFHSTHKDLAA